MQKNSSNTVSQPASNTNPATTVIAPAVQPTTAQQPVQPTKTAVYLLKQCKENTETPLKYSSELFINNAVLLDKDRQIISHLNPLNGQPDIYSDNKNMTVLLMPEAELQDEETIKNNSNNAFFFVSIHENEHEILNGQKILSVTLMQEDKKELTYLIDITADAIQAAQPIFDADNNIINLMQSSSVTAHNYDGFSKIYDLKAIEKAGDLSETSDIPRDLEIYRGSKDKINKPKSSYQLVSLSENQAVAYQDLSIKSAQMLSASEDYGYPIRDISVIGSHVSNDQTTGSHDTLNRPGYFNLTIEKNDDSGNSASLKVELLPTENCYFLNEIKAPQLTLKVELEGYLLNSVGGDKKQSFVLALPIVPQALPCSLQ